MILTHFTIPEVMSLKRQIRSAGVRSTDHLLQVFDKRSMSSDRPRSQKSSRGDARSTRSQSRSSVLDNRSPRDCLPGGKSNDDLHQKTKEALGNLIVRKDELESKGIETEIMYKELMNCVSPWRRKKLLQESEESQAALDDALKAADELLKQSKEAFDVSIFSLSNLVHSFGSWLATLSFVTLSLR